MNIPFNYADAQNSDFVRDHPHLNAYYKSLWAKAPKGTKLGNSAQNSGFKINGEVSDFMLMKHGVFALSPELGSADIKTKTFYIGDQQTLKNLLKQNFDWVKFTI
jgi:hypothetical protein